MPFSAAGVTAVIESVTFKLLTGGRGADALVDTAAIDGAVVMAWDARIQAWRTIGSNTSSSSSPSTLSITLSGDDARALVFSSAQELRFAVIPRGGFGVRREAPKAVVDDVELAVTFR